MANSYLQVRVNEEDKEKAAQILDGLGTNLSTVVNMLIKQIIITESIPFDIKLNRHNNPSLGMPQAQAAARTVAEADRKDPVIEGIREEYEW